MAEEIRPLDRILIDAAATGEGEGLLSEAEASVVVALADAVKGLNLEQVLAAFGAGTLGKALDVIDKVDHFVCWASGVNWHDQGPDGYDRFMQIYNLVRDFAHDVELHDRSREHREPFLVIHAGGRKGCTQEELQVSPVVAQYILRDPKCSMCGRELHVVSRP